MTTGTVLYIEDNDINTLLVERILRARPGVVFDSAPDGRTGLDRAERLRPDLVLLDLELPDISGERVLAGLRTGPATRAIPVIVVSADIDPAVRRRILAAGANFFLTKPYDVTDLLGLVDEALRSRAAGARPQHGQADVVVRGGTAEHVPDDALGQEMGDRGTVRVAAGEPAERPRGDPR
jgi:CheY-like chemotaxis protein